MTDRSPGRARSGAASVMAMLFLAIFATLAVAMFSMSTLNAQSATNLSQVERARAVAEAGLRWQAYRLRTMSRPRTLAGTVDATVAQTLWPQIKAAIRTDYAAMSIAAERTAPTDNGTWIRGPEIALDAARNERFQVDIAQSPADPRVLLVTSTGRVGNTTRSVRMSFSLDKKIRFAIVGKVPIQIGRNTIVEGDVAMAVPNKFPPILMLSDFMHFDSGLKTQLDAWNTFLQGSSVVGGVSVRNHNGYDNRISRHNPVEWQLALSRGYTDVNSDGYMDEYDLFVRRYDRDGDAAITRAEFTNPSTGRLYDENLFAAMDAVGAPLYDGDVTRVGFRDGVIDNYDGYAKVRGTLTIAATEAVWAADLATQGKKINDMIQGTVAVTTPTDVAVKFGASASDLFDLNPANFEDCAAGFRGRSGTNAGVARRTTGLIENTTLSAADVTHAPPSVQVLTVGRTTLTAGSIVLRSQFDAANAAETAAASAAGRAAVPATANPVNTAVERTPFGSTSFQATYRRPVFKNMTFRNVVIPRGLNAVFDNCTFEGVTFVETQRDITRSGGQVTTSASDGMGWAQRKVAGDNFSNTRQLLGAGQSPSTGQTTTQGSVNGNNLRFNDCTFRGPLAGNYATAYTHFANSWEFTGRTMFDNQVDQTATIVSPQVNIEMGSFTDPNAAPSTLIGVVVAGNIDIRGYSTVDGSIIITGDGAGNTTLAYFGASDGDTNPTAMPEGGYGKLNIRYNPHRSLPDGINVPVDILPVPGSYVELTNRP